jgi:hypothetical protein
MSIFVRSIAMLINSEQFYSPNENRERHPCYITRISDNISLWKRKPGFRIAGNGASCLRTFPGDRLCGFLSQGHSLGIGIADEENLALMRQKGYHYVCVSRKRLSDYQADSQSTVVQLTDREKNAVQLRIFRPATEQDTWMYNGIILLIINALDRQTAKLG